MMHAWVLNFAKCLIYLFEVSCWSFYGFICQPASQSHKRFNQGYELMLVCYFLALKFLKFSNTSPKFFILICTLSMALNRAGNYFHSGCVASEIVILQ